MHKLNGFSQMVLRPIAARDLQLAERAISVSGRLVAERPAGLQFASFRGEISMGAFSYANQEAVIYSANIGRYVCIAHRVMIGPWEHPTNWLSSHGFVFAGHRLFPESDDFQAIVSDETFERTTRSVSIGNDVWIGYGTMIRKGISIGNGAIIGAGSIVTKDVEPYTIVAGNPAKLIRPRFEPEIIARLQGLQWWNYHLDKKVLGKLTYSDVASSISAIEDAVADGKLDVLSPQVLVFEDKAGAVQAFLFEQ